MNRLINWVKKTLHWKKISDAQIRTLDELFKSGNILKATDTELESAIVEVANQTDQSQTIQSRNIVRGLVVNNIQNQRHADKIDQHNTFLTVVIITLTIINIILAIQQRDYVEVESRSARILQEGAIQRAVALCKQSPDLQQSGLYDTSTGNPASCSEVLKQYR